MNRKKIFVVGIITLLVIIAIVVCWIIFFKGEKKLLNTVVKVGDYVSYPVKYQNVYDETDTNNGWRVLYVKDGTIKLISEKCVFKYKHEKNSADTVEKLTTNFLETARASDSKYGINGYIDVKYALECKCLTKEDLEIWNNGEIKGSMIFDDELLKIDNKYWVANSGSTGSILAINENGYIYDYMDYKFGVRAVVTLKSDVLTSKGDGSINNPYKLVK